MKPPRFASLTHSRLTPRRGVILVLTLLGMILLASMVFYVFNTGRHLQQRVQTQSAADAAAYSAAAQTARTMNLVATNNVEMARLVAMINVLDAYPLAIDISITDESEPYMNDVTAQWLAIEHMLGRRGALPPVVVRELERARDRIGTPETNEEGTLDTSLRELDQLFKRDPDLVTDMTFFQGARGGSGGGSGGQGQIWRALQTLDAVSEAAVISHPLALHRAAAEAGYDTLGTGVPESADFSISNQDAAGAAELDTAAGSPSPGITPDRSPASSSASDDEGDARHLVAIWPGDHDIPAVRGSFQDLNHPVRNGVLPPRDLDYSADRYRVRRSITFHVVTEPGLSETDTGQWLDGRERRSAQRDDQERRAELAAEIAAGTTTQSMPPEFATSRRNWGTGTRMSEDIALDILANISYPAEGRFFNSLEFIGDEEIDRRGPYDTAFGWRWINQWRGGDFLGNPPGYSAGRRDPTHYSTFGIQEWLVRSITRTANDRLRGHLREIARIKHQYVWPEKRNESDPNSLVDVVMSDWEIDIESDNDRSRHPALARFRSGDRDDARTTDDGNGNQVPLNPASNTVYNFASDNIDQVHQTMFLVLDLYHTDQNSTFDPARQYRGPEQDTSLTPNWFIRRQSWRMYVRPWSPNEPRRSRVQRFRDPAQRPPFRRLFRRFTPPDPFPQYPAEYSYTQVGAGRYLFQEQISYQTDPFVDQGRYAFGAFPELGHYTQFDTVGTDANGNPIIEPVRESHRYWRTRYFLTVGVNVGPKLLVRDPYTGFNPNAQDAPAPWVFDSSASLGGDIEFRENMTFLAAAQKPNPAHIAAFQFDSQTKPYPAMVGLAQARVFNNHSHDLWTPMWTAQLEPIAPQLLDSGFVTDELTVFAEQTGTDADALTELVEHLRAVSTLGEDHLQH
ncbi:MAG: pilus assembly protein TadG-related protein [Planctomycetota bacterium]